jgi:hypothetical protein
MPRRIKLIYDPWNPTPDELRAWAYDTNAVEPCQDWDLVLCWAPHVNAHLELASDESCPKRRYFLAILYLLVGDAVRTNFRNHLRLSIEDWIARGDVHTHPAIRLWQERSRRLLEAPEQFNYEQWCAGGFARETDA